MSEVRRWTHTVQWEGLQISAAYMAIDHGGEYVMHADYAALEAECERLADALDRQSVITGDYIARCQGLAAERDALAAELAAIKGQEPVGVVHLRKGGGISMLQVELNTPLHHGTKLYTLPSASRVQEGT